MKLPLAIILFVVALLSLTVVFVGRATTRRTKAEQTMPPHTIFVREYTVMDGNSGELALTPDGRRWFRRADADAFQEVKP